MIYFDEIHAILLTFFIRYIINLIFLFFPVFVDRGSGNEKGLLEGKKSNELSLKTDTGNARS